MSELRTQVVGPDDWPAVGAFFEPKGLVENCWCTYFRMTAKDRSSCGPGSRKDRLREMVEAGERVGVLGSVDGAPVGWIGVGPRLGFPRLRGSRAAKLIEGDDPERIWSVVCLYLTRDHRGQGHARRLIDRAAEWARDEKADILEAYPEDDRDPGAAVDRDSFHGRVSTFEACGFTVVEPRLQRRALVRRDLR
ncbi:GNAT family N-acetyltransferase [Streptacidiphilus anmyonensis]|uniref:GNAT family N-acetyltransferase n=1 Tax=Streptacidiphilus anmyonensis TaxID=405782 RepID=UPI0009FC1DCA|nr:GNAT family N-acetyltransferase [Streptacidiphilus anmyonensis]